MAKVNIRIRNNRDGSPYTGGLTLGDLGEGGVPRKLEPGEVVTVDESVFDEFASVREMVEIVREPATRPLTFPNIGLARTTSDKFKGRDDETIKMKDDANQWLKDWQKANAPAPKAPPKASPKAESGGVG